MNFKHITPMNVFKTRNAHTTTNAKENKCIDGARPVSTREYPARLSVHLQPIDNINNHYHGGRYQGKTDAITKGAAHQVFEQAQL